jgi:hypothetical protein
MWFDFLLRTNNSRPNRKPRLRLRPALRSSRLSLEQLESRTVLSAYTAASAADLIADITAANTAGGANTITLTPAASPFLLTAVNNTADGATGLPVIAVGDNLTIVGNGNAIERSSATGTPAFRLLDVAAGGSLTLDNLTLQGGLAQGASSRGVSSEGGAIYNQGTLTLDGVTVENNVAQGMYPLALANAAGGAIYSTGALSLQGGTVLENNEALGAQTPKYLIGPGSGLHGGYAVGGALDVAGGTAAITDSTLTANTAQGGHGQTSIYAFGFGGTGGMSSGGAIYAAYGTTSLTLTRDTFSSNAARGGAGGGSGTLAYQENPYEYGISGGYADGGALDLYGGTLSAVDCNFSLNTAVGGQGGGLSPHGYPSVGGPGGGALGGAVDASADNLVSLSGGTLSSNSALGGQGGGGLTTAGVGGEACGGGAILVGGSLTGATITGNEAAGGAGGGIAPVGGQGGLARGGGLYLGDTSFADAATLTSLTITKNGATGGPGGSGKTIGPAGAGVGGGIYSDYFTTLDSAINATQTTIQVADDSPIVPGTTILIDSEVMTVTAVTLVVTNGPYGYPVAYDELTVVRGAGGTKPASHAFNATVSSLALDAFTLANLVNNNASTSNPNIYGQYFVI